ncbi:MAG: hypothetical protein HRU38_08460 [Saccharospirillaceae bacterium]|nr:hypothetical protein [Pseudomonadales bacterium]NRB78685.1 hypothetical protein [Saccharospirillaceae bacterium]
MNMIENEEELLNELLNTSVSIEKCREVLIKLLNSRTLPAQLLLEPINLLRNKKTNTFEFYKFGDGMPEISNLEVDWTTNYYDEYKVRLGFNFSYERFENLICVKSSLERDGVKGFSIKLNKNTKITPLQEAITMKKLPNNYLPPENLKESVNKGNLVYIRSAVLALLTNNNVNWTELDNAVIWALNHCNSLFDAHIEANYAKAINSNNSIWTTEYYFEQEVYLNANFSEVRWLHLLEVRKNLSKNKSKGFIRNITNNLNSTRTEINVGKNYKEKQYSNQKNSNCADLDKLKIMLKIGGGIAILAALIISIIGKVK